MSVWKTCFCLENDSVCRENYSVCLENYSLCPENYSVCLEKYSFGKLVWVWKSHLYEDNFV